MNRTKFLQLVNIILGFTGICGSLYIIGWVQHPSHLIIGTGCFFLFLIILICLVVKQTARKDKEKI